MNLFLFNTKDDILKNVWNQRVAGTLYPGTLTFIVTHFFSYGRQWLPATVWLPTFFKITLITEK